MSLQYREWAPDPRLRPWVRCFWALEHAAGAGQPERVLPDGSVELVLHYGDRFREYRPGSVTPNLQPRSLLVCGQRRFMLIEPTGVAGMIGVRFAPGAARRFVGIPLDRIGDVVAVGDLWGAEGRELEDRVRAADSDRTRGEMVEAFLLRRLDAVSDPLVNEALHVVFRSCGRVRVGDLARAGLVSPRTLERRFRAEVGLPPKELCRIARFQRVLRSLREPRPGSIGWADVAAIAGFADQAHLTRDFRDIAGLPPEAFRHERHDYTNLFVAAG